MHEPQWFYSSLAQVTAAIVGFVGGFLLLRLLEVMREWSALTDRLRERQTRWSRASQRRDQYDQGRSPERGPFEGERLKLSYEESDAWSDLYQAIQEQRASKMPNELLWSLGLVTVVAFLFALGPLIALDAPGIVERAIWLAALAAALALLAALLRAAVSARYKTLRNLQLYPHTEARLEEYELWIEGIVEREQEEQAARPARDESDEAANDHR